jgi:hypothetical protein
MKVARAGWSVYLVLVAIAAGVAWRSNQGTRPSPPFPKTPGQRPGKAVMTKCTWVKLADARVAPRPSSPWTKVLDYVPAKSRLKFEAKGSWRYGTWVFGPEGSADPILTASACLSTTAPVGALLGKIGGSTSGRDDGKIFTIGQWGFVETDEKTAGPLFLAVNVPAGVAASPPDELTVEVFDGRW